MREVCGKLIRESLEELLEPEQCALVVVDMQKGSFVKGGASWRAGHHLDMVEETAQRCGELISTARAAGVRLFHIRVANLPGHTSSSRAWLRGLAGNRQALDNPVTPAEGETVITKRRSSAFIGTELELLLRSAGIETVVVVGIVTHGCIEATIRDAAHRDFYNVLIEDCVAGYNIELHEAALKVMRARHDHCTAAEATVIWQRAAVLALAKS